MKLVKMLPQTDKQILRVAVTGMAIACVWLIVDILRTSSSGNYQPAIIPFVILLPIAAGLWLFKPWARVCALILLWLLVLSLPLAELSVWSAIDGDAPPLPIWQQLLYRFSPYIIPAVFFIEVLYGYRSEFQHVRVNNNAVDHSAVSATPPSSWLLWSAGVFATPILIVLLLELAIQLKGGCIQLPTSDNNAPVQYGNIWHIAPIACIALGLFVFLKAAPAQTTRNILLARALIYLICMLNFYAEVSSYIAFTNFC